MSAISVIASFPFQADMRLRGSRNVRRVNLVSQTQLDIPLAAESDVVRDAIVATVYDRLDVALARLADYGPVTFLGHQGRVYRHLQSLDAYVASVRETPNIETRSIFDPLVWGNDPFVNPKAQHLELLHTPAESFLDEHTTPGAVSWSNKASMADVHQQICDQCLLAVGGEIYRRVCVPTWHVANSESYEGMRGFVMLETDRDGGSTGFRFDKLELAEQLSQRRYGKSDGFGRDLAFRRAFRRDR